MFKNNIFDTDTLGMDKTYIAELVDKININFIHEYKSNNTSSTSYIYSVKATCNSYHGTSNEDKKSIIRSKEYNIINDINGSFDSNNNSLNKKVVIDYSYFVDQLNSIKSVTSFPLVSFLVVESRLRINKVVESKTITEDKIISLTIPLDQKAFNINSSYEKETNKQIMKFDNPKPYIKKELIFMSIISIILDLVLVFVLYRKRVRTSLKSKYDIEINKIFKEFSDIIVRSEHPPFDKSLAVVLVSTFKKILDLEEQLRVPIIYIETIKDVKSEFCIKHDGIVYKYILKNEDANEA